MKILFVGDASNLHNCLAHALRDLGHTAVVASNGSHWMNTERDINLKRNPGKIGAVRYVLDVLRALSKMRDFDVVQTCGHIFLDLKPGKVRRVFDFLKRHNRSIVMGALGTDYVYYTACHDATTPPAMMARPIATVITWWATSHRLMPSRQSIVQSMRTTGNCHSCGSIATMY